MCVFHVAFSCGFNCDFLQSPSVKSKISQYIESDSITILNTKKVEVEQVPCVVFDHMKSSLTDFPENERQVKQNSPNHSAIFLHNFTDGK